MVHILTIFLMLFIPWNVYSFWAVTEDESLILYTEDDLILKIAKIYWSSVLIIAALFLLWVVSRTISEAIICTASNDDNKICGRVSDK